MKGIKNITLALGLILSSLSFGQSVNCGDMAPICTDDGLDFSAQSGVAAASVTDPNNNYGCLSTTPNPTWYYLEIAQDGDLVMSLSAANDIDYIIYGPFTDLATAAAGCGTMGQGGGAPIVDCSYSGTNNETPEIGAGSSGGATTATTGEVYVLLVTNYANSVQDITLSATGGTAETDCSIVEACVSNPGTFVRKKNGVITALPLYLCEGDSFTIESNDDYILPNDTIPAPIGDGIYTAQLMWLVYTGVPDGGNDPINDPNYSGSPANVGYNGLVNIIPNEDLAGTNVASNALLQSLGGDCGTYYFVPVAGDDGVGVGADDNGGITWDKNDNGCFLFGDAISVTFACPITVTPNISCDGLTINGNAMDIALAGGAPGNYTIVNQGFGNLSSTSVAQNGAVSISNLSNGNDWSIDVEDAQGCTASANGTFAAATITTTGMIEATTCPGASLGNVTAEIGTTGQAPYTVEMNGGPAGAGPVYTMPAGAVAGTLVNIVAADNNSCVDVETVTIGSQGHFILGSVISSDSVSCFGLTDGSASFSFLPQDAAGNPDGNLISVTWTDPDGNVFGNTAASHLSESGTMMPGEWFVEAEDDQNCTVMISVFIGQPQELDIYSVTENSPTCNDVTGQADGSITVAVTPNDVYSPIVTWGSSNPVAPNNVNGLTTNQCKPGVYEAYVVDANGCKDTLEMTLINPEPIEIDSIIKHVLCYGDSTGQIIITDVYNAQGGSYDYDWTIVPSPPLTEPADSVHIAAGLPEGLYNLKIEDAYGCHSFFEFEIIQNSELQITVWDTSAICRTNADQFGYGKIDGEIVRLAPQVGGPFTPLDNNAIYWTSAADGSHPPNPEATTWGQLNPGQYIYEAIDEYGCVASKTVTVDSLNPIAQFTATSPQFTSDYVGTAVVSVEFVNESQNYNFTNHPDNAPNANASNTFTWSFGLDSTALDTTADHSRTYSMDYLKEGLYTVCLVVEENLNHCIDSTCIDIQIYDVPKLIPANVFTPGASGSGDGINDVFIMPNEAIVTFEMTIFDRWGKEVFKSNDILNGWNGDNQNNDKPCTDGVYFYVYDAVSSNGTEFKGQGNVHLIRE